MRKWLFAFFLLVLVAGAIIYYLIPGRMMLSQTITVPAHQSAVFRCLTRPPFIKKWWQQSTANRIQSGDFIFHFKPSAFDVVEVATYQGQTKLPDSYISIMPLQKHTSLVQWKLDYRAGQDPLERIGYYFRARKVQNSMTEMFAQLEDFMQAAENVYGLKIDNATVTDTLLVTTRRRGSSFPSVREYYDMIHMLQDHINTSGAAATNYPMLHVLQVDTNLYETTVAIPLNKAVPDKGEIRLNRMIRGNILTAEVKGGIHSVMEGMQQMEHFVLENSLASPAMPFQQLVTNRMQEPDSLKWTTRIYYPVI